MEIVTPETKIFYRRILSLFTLLLMAAPSFAVPLQQLQFFGDNTNGTNYISTLFGTVTSPDGNFVYTISFNESAITVFSRDQSTKLLNFVEATLEDTTNKTGVHNPRAIEASPDNKFIYVAGLEPGFGVNGTADPAIVVFQRDEISGYLTTLQVFKDQHLADPLQITISADGSDIYVTSYNMYGVLVLHRAANGILSEQQFQSNYTSGFSGQDTRPYAAAMLSPDEKNLYLAVEQDSNSPYGAIISHFSRDSATGNITYVDQVDYTQPNLTGLDDLQGLGISPDGKFLYATSASSTPNSSISIFSIDVNGSLGFSERYTLNDPTGNPVQLYWPNDIVFSHNGKLAYVSDSVTDALLVFNRSAATGSLTYLGAEVNNKDGVIDIKEPRQVALSPDDMSAFISGADGLTVFDIHTKLSLTNTATVTSVAPNQTDTFKLEVANPSGVTAHNTTLTFAPPAGSSITAINPASNSTLCSQTNSVVTCAIGSLAGSADEIVSISLSAPSALGTAAAQASVTADEVDESATNSASASITVSSNPSSDGSTTNSTATTDTGKKGGGGSFDWSMLFAFSLLALARLRKPLNEL